MNQSLERKLTAIMFADIVSYSRMMGLNEGEALKILSDFDSISIPIVEKFNGILIKKNGDEIFCEFASAKNAVDASIEIQNNLTSYNDSRPKDFRLEVRIGIHIGDVVKKDGDIFGDGVNVAARIQPLAAPGGICISGLVSEALSSHPDYNIISKGKHELKHIVQQHSVYDIQTGHERIVKSSVMPTKKFKYLFFLSFIILLVIYLTYKSNIISPDLSKPSSKRIFLSKILSSDFSDKNFDLLEMLMLVVDDSESRDLLSKENVILNKISIEDNTVLYDEIISNLHLNISNYELLNHYDYKDHSNSSGITVYDYNELSIYNFLKSSIGVGENIQVIFDQYYSGSIFQIINNNFDLGIAPIIYKIYKNGKFTGDYIVSLAYLVFNMDSDGGFNISMGGDSFISQRDRISNDISNNISRKISEFIYSEKNSYIKIIGISSDTYTIKFSSNYKNKIKERLILSVKREYYYNHNIDKDSLLAIRYDELIEYKNKIDSNPNSKYFNDFYSDDNQFWSNKELQNIKTNNWFNLEAGGIEFELMTKLKILKVYDSTAVATIYSVDDPNKIIKVGDELEY